MRLRSLPVARSAFLAVSLLITAPAGTQTGPIPPDAHLKGMWSPVTPWPVIGIHAVLLPEGRVLTYGTDTAGRQTGYFTYDVWDPAAGLGAGHLTLPNGTGTDIFCGPSRSGSPLSENPGLERVPGFFVLRDQRTLEP